MATWDTFDSTGSLETMNLGDLLTPEGVIASLTAKNKKQALQELSK
jgi:hypothetical protein